MNRKMELNGIANISILLQVEADVKDNGLVTMNLETFNSIRDELENLERYMIAYNKAIRDGVQTPHWHEVRDNPHLYPLNREIVD